MKAAASTIAAWRAFEPTADAPWNVQRVVHLHRRAAFSATWEQIERDLEEGPQAAVDRLLAGRQTREASEKFAQMAAAIGDAAQASDNLDRLKAWWVYRMLQSPDPLRERLTLMWHNHFATSNRKVGNLVLMRQQNDLFRKHAMAPFGDLLGAIVRHPAMLIWLDADSNRRGAPNENLARELMELFTLGIGNYSENDVQQAARALTGWSVADGDFRYLAERHDDGQKQVLGVSGRLSGGDLIDVLLKHPATARRLAWRLCELLCGEGVVNGAALGELADGLQEHNLEIGWGVATILRSERFFSPANMRSRVMGPAEFALGTLHALELCSPPPSSLLVADWIRRMGQDLFNPPNVGGWPAGRTWLGSRSVVARANFAAALVEGRLWSTARPPDLWALVRRYHADADMDRAVRFLLELLWGQCDLTVLERCLSATPNQPDPKRALAAALYTLLSLPQSQLG